MTAAALRLPPAGLPVERDDRRLLAGSLTVALALHVVALIALPLPDPPEPPPRPVYTGPAVVETDLRPPELPPRPTPRASARAERLPVPFDVVADVAPVEERAPVSVRAPEGVELTPPIVDAVPPPLVDPVIWSDDDPRLELPVPQGERARPDYPDVARRVGLGGTVVLRAVIDETGAIVSIEVLSAPRPDLGFSEAAIAAVSRWRYRPGTVDGRPVAVALRVIVEFVLD